MRPMRAQRLSLCGVLVALAFSSFAGPAQAQKGLQVRLFKLKHRTSNDIIRAVRGLGSGSEGSRVDEASATETITVRDLPGNVAAIAKAIKELDVAMPDIQLRIDILMGGPDGTDNYPTALGPAVAQLKPALKYKVYHHVAGVLQRVNGGGWANNRGVANLDASVAGREALVEYQFKLQALVVPDAKPPAALIRGLDFDADSKQIGNVDINADFTVRQGETVVVGSATVNDRAYVLLVSASIL